jgi:hypothetical protein
MTVFKTALLAGLASQAPNKFETNEIEPSTIVSGIGNGKINIDSMFTNSIQSGPKETVNKEDSRLGHDTNDSELLQISTEKKASQMAQEELDKLSTLPGFTVFSPTQVTQQLSFKDLAAILQRLDLQTLQPSFKDRDTQSASAEGSRLTNSDINSDIDPAEAKLNQLNREIEEFEKQPFYQRIIQKSTLYRKVADKVAEKFQKSILRRAIEKYAPSSMFSSPNKLALQMAVLELDEQRKEKEIRKNRKSYI